MILYSVQGSQQICMWSENRKVISEAFDLLAWKIIPGCCCYLWLINGILAKDMLKKCHILLCYLFAVCWLGSSVFLILNKAKLSVVTTAISKWAKQANCTFFFLKCYLKMVGLPICHTSSGFSVAVFAQLQWFFFFSKN